VKPEGRQYYETLNPSTGDKLSRTIQSTAEDIDTAVKAAKDAQPAWAALPGHVRARYLYSIARHIQKHFRLLSVIESLDNGMCL
jgi:aldehyde dehydrogenase (NAD+)